MVGSQHVKVFIYECYNSIVVLLIFCFTVSAGSDVIPESIQKCHSLTRQLEKNQTKINNQLQRVAQRLSNFSSMVNIFLLVIYIIMIT